MNITITANRSWFDSDYDMWPSLDGKDPDTLRFVAVELDGAGPVSNSKATATIVPRQAWMAFDTVAGVQLRTILSDRDIEMRTRRAEDEEVMTDPRSVLVRQIEAHVREHLTVLV